MSRPVRRELLDCVSVSSRGGGGSAVGNGTSKIWRNYVVRDKRGKEAGEGPLGIVSMEGTFGKGREGTVGM